MSLGDVSPSWDGWAGGYLVEASVIVSFGQAPFHGVPQFRLDDTFDHRGQIFVCEFLFAVISAVPFDLKQFAQ